MLVTQLLDESHTSVYLRDTLLKIIDDWKLNGKVVAVVSDNAANIVKAIGPDGCKLTHIPCFAHSLSLVVKAAIADAAEIAVTLTNCRNIVTFVHSSHNATATLNRLRGDSSLKKLQQDVPTRLNSTLIMIRSILKMKDDVEDMWRTANNIRNSIEHGYILRINTKWKPYFQLCIAISVKLSYTLMDTFSFFNEL